MNSGCPEANNYTNPSQVLLASRRGSACPVLPEPGLRKKTAPYHNLWSRRSDVVRCPIAKNAGENKWVWASGGKGEN